MSFFSTLQDHSEVKLSILKQYTIPWMRKIILNKYGNRKCLIIDGFAGKGKYQDDKMGSPLILIENAIDFYNQAKNHGWDDPEIFIFLNEYDLNNYLSLTTYIKEMGFSSQDNSLFASDMYKSIVVKVSNLTFEDFITDLLANIKEGYSLIPSFCFVDPFGFSTTPFRLFKEFLKNNNSEVLLNFIYEETNRFLRHPSQKIQQQIQDQLGLVGIDEISQKVSNKTPLERKQIIVETYTNRIIEETEAVFVKNFEIKKNGRTKMILFHMTKNYYGLKTMKETMWKHDETGTYTYDDRNNFIQLDFENIIANDKKNHINILSEIIYEKFKSSKSISIEELEHFVVINTIYPSPNFLKPSLRILEDRKLITNFRGRVKNKSYPDGCLMDFI